jgi:hypothetical protein
MRLRDIRVERRMTQEQFTLSSTKKYPVGIKPWYLRHWATRTRDLLEWNEPPETLLVSVADKLYNARAILKEYRQIGSEVWSRFKRGRKHQLWYFDELIKVYEERCSTWQIGRSSSPVP